jgi:prefoldin alpha subunit
MIPLTSSLYVPGIMEENEQVLVEVGAGYFIEKSSEKAKEYCDRKIKMLNENGGKVAEII